MLHDIVLLKFWQTCCLCLKFLILVAAAIKELRQAVLPTMVALVRHYTMVAIAQQAGPFPMNTKQNKLNGMDPLVLIDAMAVIMGHEEKGK